MPRSSRNDGSAAAHDAASRRPLDRAAAPAERSSTHRGKHIAGSTLKVLLVVGDPLTGVRRRHRARRCRRPGSLIAGAVAASVSTCAATRPMSAVVAGRPQARRSALSSMTGNVRWSCRAPHVRPAASGDWRCSLVSGATSCVAICTIKLARFCGCPAGTSCLSDIARVEHTDAALHRSGRQELAIALRQAAIHMHTQVPDYPTLPPTFGSMGRGLVRGVQGI